MQIIKKLAEVSRINNIIEHKFKKKMADQDIHNTHQDIHNTQ
jgi:hypothetical protein